MIKLIDCANILEAAAITNVVMYNSPFIGIFKGFSAINFPK